MSKPRHSTNIPTHKGKRHVGGITETGRDYLQSLTLLDLGLLLNRKTGTEKREVKKEIERRHRKQ